MRRVIVGKDEQDVRTGLSRNYDGAGESENGEGEDELFHENQSIAEIAVRAG